MSKFDVMGYIIYAAVLHYGIYLTIQNVCLFPANEKAREEYLNKYKDGYTMINQYLPCMISFLGFSVIGIVDISMTEKNTKDELYVCFALASMAITSAGMALGSIVRRQAIVDDDGFTYEKAHYCSHFILSMGPMRSIIKDIDILTTER